LSRSALCLLKTNLDDVCFVDHKMRYDIIGCISLSINAKNMPAMQKW